MVETATEPSGKKVCRGCGTPNEPTSDYCYKCGMRLPAEVQAASALGDPAGFWIRFGAFLIDAIILLIVGTAVTLVLSDLPPAGALRRLLDPDAPLLVTDFWVSFGVETAYFTVAIGRWGRTVGKFLLRLKVTREDGSRVSYPRSFGRYLAWYLSWLLLGLGFLAIGLSSRKQGLHDLICGTRVVRV